jgi:hypothetical protein
VKAPSPLLGFNNNVRHKGRVFHIQTEDSGIRHPHIITHLFADGGRILKTTKTSYTEHLGQERLAETVRAMMQEQHKAMFIALRDGQFDYLFEESGGPGSLKSPPKPAASSSSAAAVAVAQKGGEGAINEAASGPKVQAPPEPAAEAPASALAAQPSSPGPEAGSPVIPASSPSVSEAASAPSPPSSDAGSAPEPQEPPPSPMRPLPPLPPRKPLPPVPRPGNPATAMTEPAQIAAVMPAPPASPVVMEGLAAEVALAPGSRRRGASRPTLDVDPGAIHGVPSAEASIDLDLDALERAAAEAQTPFFQQIQDLPPPPAAVLGSKRGSTGGYTSVRSPVPPAGAGHNDRAQIPGPGLAPRPAAAFSSAVEAGSGAPARVPHLPVPPLAASSAGRYAPSRPASIFATTRPQEGASIFGEDLISEKSLDEVILSYLAEDLDGPAEKK